jgi:hypothetical protein
MFSNIRLLFHKKYKQLHIAVVKLFTHASEGQVFDSQVISIFFLILLSFHIIFFLKI